MKKILSILTVLVMLFAMTAPAFAARDTAHTITITNRQPGHTYEAYQVFSGVLDEESQLNEITWGSGVNGTGLLAELKNLSAYADCATAADVAAVLSGFNNNSEQLDDFASVVGKHLATVSGTSEQSGDDAPYSYNISVTGDGYYFIKDKDDSLEKDEGEEEGAYTKFMLQVVDNVAVTAKADFPTIEKKIDGDEDGDDDTTGLVDANTADVGDMVPYVLSSKVPNMNGYNAYIYQIHDKMTEGLTFQPDTVVVKIGDQTLEKDTDYTLITNPKDGCTFEIDFINFVQYAADQEIKVTFDALINEKAKIGVEGNPNDVKLRYSNNPNHEYKPGEPDQPVGETPWDTVITYLTDIELLKVDSMDKNVTLTGAKFSIEGITSNVKWINGVMFKEDPNGDYWRLKDGTYTTTAPIDDTTPDDGVDQSTEYLYDSTTVKFSKVDFVTKETIQTPFTAEGWVNDRGILTFKGLGEGTYTIKEIVAPTGYNLLTEDIVVKIEASDEGIVNPTHATQIGWSATAGEEGKNWTVDDDGTIKITVENKSGSVLPETGAMGTTLFVTFGSLAVFTAVVFLVTRKKMSVYED